MSIDTSRNFVPLHIVVCSISDTRTIENDTSGSFLCDALLKNGHILQERTIIKDDLSSITHHLQNWIEQDDIDIILCTGGTGLTDRDVTPEALENVVEKWYAVAAGAPLFQKCSFR